jgi:formylglycine-generating enzyme required for sulfatase activity
MLSIQRRFADLFAGEKWTPLTPVLMRDVYASLWEGDGVRLWTVVNRSSNSREGALMQIELRNGERVFDLITGEEAVLRGNNEVQFSIRPRGLGGIIAATPEVLGRDFPEFLLRQRNQAARSDWDAEPPVLHTTLKPVPVTRRYDHDTLPNDMVAIPAATFRLKTEFRIRECGFYDSTDPVFVQAIPPLHRPITFERDATLKPYAIAQTPVTNAQFAEFLKASRYQPPQSQNFLKHWIRAAPPLGKEDHPVVYVDMDDARAYARWSGKRLATEEEWQYAAQGPDSRKYPWGDEMGINRCNRGETGGTTHVRAFPDGRSPFGVYDLCGNVWEWTESERSDGRTRFCIVRGGSFYQARGSVWYADGGPQPCCFAAKFLLMWPGLDRCATIGFRCAVDLVRS